MRSIKGSERTVTQVELNSFFIFKNLHYKELELLLKRLKMSLRGLLVSALYNSSVVENKRADSIAQQLWSLQVLISCSQIQLYDKEIQTEIPHSALLTFIRFEFNEIAQA